MYSNIYNDEEEDQSKIQALIRAKNNRLNTSSLKKLMLNKNEGDEILKNEIAESY